jgi:hypothetical protein
VHSWLASYDLRRGLLRWNFEVPLRTSAEQITRTFHGHSPRTEQTNARYSIEITGAPDKLVTSAFGGQRRRLSVSTSIYIRFARPLVLREIFPDTIQTCP